MLEGAWRLETLCRSVEDTLNAPAVQVGTNRAENVERAPVCPVLIWFLFAVAYFSTLRGVSA